MENQDLDRIARRRAGWAIGLAFHGLGVFFLASGSALRQRMIERERRLLDGQTR